MFWRQRPDVVEAWYARLDALLGRVEERLAARGREQTRIVVLSDHGSTDFDYKVHLNRWLLEKGSLVTGTGDKADSLQDAVWPQTRAYAIGLNSLYINLEGREGQGCVSANEYQTAVAQLKRELEAWQGPDGRPVVRRAIPRDEVFVGPLADYGPDLVVGYARGYRASSETGLGRWGGTAIESNGDQWGGDHCVDAQIVPGVIFCNQGLGGIEPSYHDIPALTIGAEPDASHTAPPPAMDQEDQDIVEERLRGLGYL
jgi:hypothetical protein